jgi:3'-5' exoribonuclease
MSNANRAIIINGKRLLVECLPTVFRLTAYTAAKIGDRLFCCSATIYHRHVILNVVWTVRKTDPALRVGELVAIRWNARSGSDDDVVQIACLEPVTVADERTNLFDTVPPRWPVEESLLERGRALIRALPRRFKHLFNAIFWDGQRFLRYTTGPASLDQAHDGLNGNLRHAIEVAERAQMLAADDPLAFRPLVILGGLLHDAGKADRYQLHPDRDCFTEINHGCRVSHRAMVLDWLSDACAVIPLGLPADHERALFRLLMLVSSRPIWDPMDEVDVPSRETRLVECADRWSMSRGAIRRVAPADSKRA